MNREYIFTRTRVYDIQHHIEHQDRLLHEAFTKIQYVLDSFDYDLDVEFFADLADWFYENEGNSYTEKSNLIDQWLVFDEKSVSIDKKKQVVYLLAEEDGEYIKIGTTLNIERRISDLQAYNPKKLNLVLLLDGGYELEKFLHNKFREYRHHREWFFYTDEIKAFVENNKSKCVIKERLA